MGFWSKIVDTVASHKDGDFYISRTEERVAKFLQFMLAENCALIVQISGNTDSFRSAVVSVDTKTNKFVIDELSPRDGNELIIKGRGLNFTVQSRGLNALFSSSVEAVERNDGIVSFVCDVPAEIRYREDRQFYRYLIGVKRCEFVMVEKPGEKTKGTIFDVSEGGVGVLLDGGYTLRVGAAYPCFVTFEDNDRIVADMLVRHIAPDKEDTAKRRVGLEFNKLESKDKKTVKNLCDTLNREFLQRIFK